MKKIIKLIKKMLSLNIEDFIDGMIVYILSPLYEYHRIEVPNYVRIKIARILLFINLFIIGYVYNGLTLIATVNSSLSAFMQKSIINKIVIFLSFILLIISSILFIQCIIFLIIERIKRKKSN